MFRDCDYVRTKDGIIFIVQGDYHTKEYVRALPVYFPDKKGDRISAETEMRYRKTINPIDFKEILSIHPEYFRTSETNDDFIGVSISNIEVHYKPREKLKELLESKKSKNTTWFRCVDVMNKIGVSSNDIGLFGSMLVGLEKDVSDADILIYGKRNFLKLKKNLDRFLASAKLKIAEVKDLEKRINSIAQTHQLSLEELREHKKRQWNIMTSGKNMIEIFFVHKDNEIPKNPITSPVIKEVGMRGRVVDVSGSNFFPRVIKVEVDDRIVDVVTYFWIFHSCVKNDEEVEIIGNLRKDNERTYITLDKTHHKIVPVKFEDS
jgi:hypothetical protein